MRSEAVTHEMSRFCPEGQTTGRDKGRLLCLSRVPRVLKGRGTGQQAVPSGDTLSLTSSPLIACISCLLTIRYGVA